VEIEDKNETKYRCVGASITFEENSYNAEVSSWEWSFPGATPNVSTDTTPTISYNSPGVYSYSVKVSSAGGSDSITINNKIVISDTVADYQGFGYYEDFENSSIFMDDWILASESGWPEWQRNVGIGYTGTASLSIDNSFETSSNKRDAFISPSIDLTTVSNPVF